MKKSYLLFILFSCFLFSLSAQKEGESTCQSQVNLALEYIYGSDTIEQDVIKGSESLRKLASQDCLIAKYALGKIYYHSSYISNLSDDQKNKNIYRAFKNTSEAFNYVNDAASKRHLKSITLLGQLYRNGYGCKLDYEKAMRLFKSAHEQGDEVAAFLIGYCYYKGLGSIGQNYSKAIEWFNKTNYSMAKHFLAVCNYFGHGMPVNKDKALAILLDNQHLSNSAVLLRHLAESYENGVEGVLSDFKGSSIEEETEKVNAIITTNVDINSNEVIEEGLIKIDSDRLIGKWSGQLVDLDYSGKRIMRSFPANMIFNTDLDTGGVTYEATLNNQISKNTGVLLDNSLYFNDFKVNLPVLYKDYVKIDEHNYTFLSADLELKKIGFTEYLVAYVEVRNNFFNEPASPKLLILSKNNIETANGEVISEELIHLLLENQGDNFITLYPNPFKTDLLIQYELTEDAIASVEVYTLDGIYYNKLVDNEQQLKGKKIYHLDGRILNTGAYVVRVTANGAIHTKLILKK